MNLVREAATVGSLTLVSRLLGFLRDAMIAAFLGAGVVADAFFVSFKLANLLRRLFAEGAFNAAFVPLFAKTLEGEGPDEARRFAQETLSNLAFMLFLVVLLAELFMPWLVRAIAAGFDPAGERFRLSVELSRLTFPYLAFISVAALYGGILNAIGRFWVAAFAPTILNLVLIAALLLGSLYTDMPARPLAWGVSIAGVLQLLLLVWTAARNGFRLRLTLPRRTERVRRLNALVIPGSIGAGVYQINLIVDTWFASHLPEGAVSYLFYADRLNQLPLGLIGVALGTVLLPLLSRNLRSNQRAAALTSQNRAIEMALLLTLPSTMALIVLAEPIMRVLFQRGAFGPEATVASAAALAAFSVGLPAYVLIKVLVPAFFAREDTRTPVIVAGMCLVINVVLILLLIDRYQHVGIALATALANCCNAVFLGVILWRRGDLAPDARLLARLPRILAASLLMGFALWVGPAGLAFLPEPVALLLLCAGGAFVFVVVAEVIGATDLREIRGQIAARRA